MPSDHRALAEQCKSATLAALEALGGTGTRAAIREHALALGGFTPEQLAIPGPPSKPQFPTLASYYIGWSLSWLKKEGLVFNVARGIWSTSPDLNGPLRIDVADRHAELVGRRRRWPWSQRG